MTAVLQVHAIMHISIGIPIIWLTTKTHELGECSWGIFFMGIVVDTLYDVCIEIHNDSSRILDEDFIINIFDDIGKDIPELKNIWSISLR